MKILQVHNFYQIQGGECAVVTEEKKLLEEAGHDVVQFTKHSEKVASGHEILLFSLRDGCARTVFQRNGG